MKNCIILRNNAKDFSWLGGNCDTRITKKDLCTHYWQEKHAFSHHFVQLALFPEINYAACQQPDRLKTKCPISS